MNSSEKKYSSILLFLSCVCTCTVFWPVVTHLNTAMFGVTGDGLKNYYAVIYFLQHDQGIHFTGMNYPFGEHLSFADGQPGLVVPFKWLCTVFPALKQYGIGLINGAMLFAIAIAPWFYYRILLKFQTNHVFAVTGALLVTWLSPQLFRLPAHYALSYPFFFGAAWFMFIKTEEHGKISTGVWTILLIVWLGLLHFYLAVIACCFFAAYSLFITISRLKNDSWKLHITRWLIVLLPIMLLQLFMLVTDTISDRPAKPWGFFYAIANWTSVFVPHILDLFGTEKLKMNDQFAEGFAYIGIVPCVFCIVFPLHLLIAAVTGNIRKIQMQLPARYYFFGIAAVLLLFFSMNMPFKWGLHSLVDQLPFLKQFRAPGRFAWVFYYVTGIFTVVYCSNLYRRISRPFLKKSILVIFVAAACIWFSECVYRANMYRKWSETALQNYMRFAGHDMRELLAKAGRYGNEFGSILVLPYFHVGSEKFDIENNTAAFYAMKASVQWGLPMMNVMMSRTSIQQSCDAVQLLSDSLIEKKLLTRLPGDPVLVMAVTSKLSEKEKLLIKKGKLLITTGEFSLYELIPASLKTNIAATKMQAERMSRNFQHHTGFRSSDSLSVATVLFLDTTGGIMQSKAGVHFNAAANILFEGPSYYQPGDTINLSLWVKIDPLAESLPIVICTQLDSTGNAVSSSELLFKKSNDVYNKHVLATGNYVIAANTKIIRVLMYKPGTVFNIVIRKKAEQIYIPSGKSFYYNNIFIE